MSYLTDNTDASWMIYSDLTVKYWYNPISNNITQKPIMMTKEAFARDYVGFLQNRINSGIYDATYVTDITLVVAEFGVLNGNWTKAQVDSLLANAVAQGKPFYTSHNLTARLTTDGTLDTAKVLAGDYGISTVSSFSPQINSTIISKTLASPDATGETFKASAKPYSIHSSSYTDSIQKAYIAYFGRPADPTGLNYWDDIMKGNGGNLADTTATFGSSTEYNNTYAGMNNSQRVDAIYQGLFGRSSEKAGLEYWVGQLDAGKLNISSVVMAVLSGSQGTDAQVVNNRVSAANTFTQALNNETLLSAYSGQKSGAQAKTWLSTVTSDSNTLTSANSSLAGTLNTLGATGSSQTSPSGKIINLDGSRTSILTYSVADIGRTDMVNGWESDKIEVSKLGFVMGNATGSLAVTVREATEQQTKESADFFQYSKGIQAGGVLITHVNNDSFVYIDANRDGSFTASSDITIKVVGATVVVDSIMF